MSLEVDSSIPAVRHRLKGVVTYEVPADDFERIKEEGSAVGTDLQFATVCIPVAITLTITLCTVTITRDRLFEVFFLWMLVFYVLGIFFGFRAWRQRGRFGRLMNRIVALQVGPIGEQGKELRPSELESLPLQSAPPTTVEPLEVVAAARVVKEEIPEVREVQSERESK
jgi:hypothetical protein